MHFTFAFCLICLMSFKTFLLVVLRFFMSVHTRCRQDRCKYRPLYVWIDKFSSIEHRNNAPQKEYFKISF